MSDRRFMIEDRPEGSVVIDTLCGARREIAVCLTHGWAETIVQGLTEPVFHPPSELDPLWQKERQRQAEKPSAFGRKL